MKATELRAALRDLAGLFRAGGAKAPAADLEVLAGRIDTSNDQSADAALDQFEREVEAMTPTNLTPKLYIKAFHEAGLDEAAFVKIFQRFKNDKSIKKADAIEVMKGYAGDHARARSKSEAVEEIERRFSELVYDNHSHRRASSTTPW